MKPMAGTWRITTPALFYICDAPVMATGIGLSRSTAPAAEDYSLLSVVRGGLNDSSLQVQPDEGRRERAIARNLAEHQPRGLVDRGLLLPPQALVNLRAASTATHSGGGALVGSKVMLADALAAETVLGQLGARFRQLATGAGDRRLVALPSKAQAYWIKEGVGLESSWEADLSDSGITELGWNDVSARVEVTRRFLLQSPENEQELRTLLRSGVASSVEEGVLAGDGGAEPIGLADPRSGVTQHNWSGAVPTTLEASTALKQIATAGRQPMNRLGWLVSMADFPAWLESGTLKEVAPGVLTVGTRPCLFTNYLSQGTAIVGDFSQLYVTLYGATSLVVNPYLNDYSVMKIQIYQAVGTGVARADLLRLYKQAA